MGEQLDLPFDTSAEAEKSVSHSRLEKLVLGVIERAGDAGIIADEIRAALPQLAYSSVTARFRALLDDGSIEIIGTRRGSTGRAQRVYIKSRN